MNEVNQVYPRQANITFTNVIDGETYNFSYDTDHDGALLFDVNSQGVPCYPFPATTPCRTSASELGPLLDAFYGAGQHIQGDAIDFQALYFKSISDPSVGGYSLAGRPSLPAIIRTDYTEDISSFAEIATAHEIGHILGRGAKLTVNGQPVQTGGHETRNCWTCGDFLMLKTGAHGCRLSRDDWNIMNFTQGTQIPDANGHPHP